MYIKKVTALAFGPLVDQTLELAPGMTVMAGDNEAAKSTWHAAIYAGLCGRRRGRGAAKSEDREFAAAWRPWHRDEWKVRCEVVLDDNRTVTLQHDLDGKVDCRATDERGLDLSGEIMHDGAPDGSVWLGLNRRTFAATACVNQAEMLRVLEAADALQTDIQRAAATAGKDQTAASALDALSKYSAEHVGLDRANSTKPLRRAAVRRKVAEEAQLQARAAHTDYLKLVGELQHVEAAAERASEQRRQSQESFAAAERLRRVVQQRAVAEERAAAARAMADDRRQRAEILAAESARAHELAASLPADEPATPSATGEVTSQAIERLHQHYVKALAVAEASKARAVEPPQADDSTLESVLQADPAVVQGIVNRLETPKVEPEPQLVADVRAAAADQQAASEAVADADSQESAAYARVRAGQSTVAQVAVAGPSRSRLWLVAGAVLGVLGLVLALTGHPWAAALVAGAGVTAANIGRLAFGGEPRARVRERAGDAAADARLDAVRERARAARSTLGETDRVLVDAQTRLEVARSNAQLAANRRQAAEQEARALGLPPDAVTVRRLIEQARLIGTERAAAHQWRVEDAAAQRQLEDCRDRLADALGVSCDADSEVEAAYSAYGRDCQSRTDQARKARELRLEFQTIADGRSLGQMAAAAQAARQTAEDATAHLSTADAELAAVSREVAQAAARAGMRLPVDERAVDGFVAASRAQLEAAQTRESESEREAANRQGQVAERKRCLPDVAEAEEAVDRAQRELVRLRSLDEVLDSTIGYLKQARDETYNDLAPVLNEALERWLPTITNGRYQRARVDPRSLAVKIEVPSGELRSAETLSIGTAEQVYLLLRIALTQHLARTSAVSPLLLDDVTVQADPTRTAAILRMCKTLADEGRQIVLFAQEPSVASWAELHLDGARDRLIRLPVPAAA